MSRYRIDARIARLFNTYGPRMATNDGFVVSNFILQSRQTEPLSIYGAGNQTRSLCYVNDTVEVRIAPVLGVLLTRHRVSLKLMAVSDPPLSPINLGNPEEFNISELADLVLSEAKTRIP